MAAPTRPGSPVPVPEPQQRAFELAVAERLGIDPTTAVLNTWRVEDDRAVVTLDFHLDPDELLGMFNTGKVPAGYRVLPQPSERPWCRDCGPGYRLGDEGCRHDNHDPSVGDTGICRTCALPIWYEAGEIDHRERVDWSDRIKRGGDSIVCFKAVGYRHVPMGAREEAIYRAGVKAGKAGV